VSVLPVLFVLAHFLSAAAPAGEPIATRHLTIATSATKETVAPGATVALNVDITPKASMHVYAPGQKDYIPVSITLAKNPAIKPLTVRFPTPEKREVKELGETQLVYNKAFRIVQEVAVGKNPAPKPGPLTVNGTVKYQACDDSICYAPITVPVTWTVTVTKASSR
jgi:DsbC/DsbD-like thiol-disulfide interchange protein